MEVRYFYRQTAAGANGSGTYLFPIPSGVTIDTAKCPVSTSPYSSVGWGKASDQANGASSASRNIDVTAYDTLSLFPYEHLLWASDFPHTDSTWPRSRELIAEQAGHLTEDQHQAIFRDNTARLFNLPAGERSWRMANAAAVA